MKLTQKSNKNVWVLRTGKKKQLKSGVSNIV